MKIKKSSSYTSNDFVSNIPLQLLALDRFYTNTQTLENISFTHKKQLNGFQEHVEREESCTEDELVETSVLEELIDKKPFSSFY